MIVLYVVCIDLKEEDIPEDAPFQCVDCENGIHRCFKCKEFDLEEDMIKCTLSFCGKYYHKKCMSTYQAGKASVCPLHTCAESGIVSTVPFSSDKSTLWRCFRCPVAYEAKKRPRDVHIITSGLFLCIRHVQEEEELPEVSPELFKTLLVRSRMHSYGGRDVNIRAQQLHAQREKMNETASRARQKFAAIDESSSTTIAVLKRKRKLKNRGNDSSDSDSSEGSNRSDGGERGTNKQKASKAMKQRLRRRKANRRNNVHDWHTSYPAYYQIDTQGGVNGNIGGINGYQNPPSGGSTYPTNDNAYWYGGYAQNNHHDYYNQSQHHEQRQEDDQPEWTESDQMLMEHHQERRRAAAAAAAGAATTSAAAPHDHGDNIQGYHHDYHDGNGHYMQHYDYEGHNGGSEYGYSYGSGYGYGPGSHGYESGHYGSSYNYGDSGGGGYGQYNGYQENSTLGYSDGYPCHNNVHDDGKMNPMDLLARLKNQGILPN